MLCTLYYDFKKCEKKEQKSNLKKKILKVPGG